MNTRINPEVCVHPEVGHADVTACVFCRLCPGCSRRIDHAFWRKHERGDHEPAEARAEPLSSEFLERCDKDIANLDLSASPLVKDSMEAGRPLTGAEGAIKVSPEA